jgi:hypothetical protein
MRRLLVLALCAVAYVLAAWMVSPGFFDGLAPPAPYHWVSPAPDFRSTNKPPESGQATVPVKAGAAQSGHVATADSQASISFPAQTFEVPSDGSSITVAVKPAAIFPDLGGIEAAGNVYSITASTRMISPSVITLRYVQLEPAPPTQIFTASDPSGPWRAIPPVNTAVPASVAGSAQALGYFVVGYPPASAPTQAATAGSSGPPISPLLLVVVAAVVLAVLAGLPLLAGRRRASAEAESAEATPSRNRGGSRRRPRRRGRR